MMHNPNCDGAKCTKETGTVKVYPLGAGGNLILCYDCFENENNYRKRKIRDGYSKENFPIINWSTAKVYIGE